MGRLGMGELIVILIIILIIFGAGKLPQIGEALGKGIRNFKKASSGEDDKGTKQASKPEQPPQSQNDDSKKV